MASKSSVEIEMMISRGNHFFVKFKLHMTSEMKQNRLSPSFLIDQYKFLIFIDKYIIISPVYCKIAKQFPNYNNCNTL